MELFKTTQKDHFTSKKTKYITNQGKKKKIFKRLGGDREGTGASPVCANRRTWQCPTLENSHIRSKMSRFLRGASDSRSRLVLLQGGTRHVGSSKTPWDHAIPPRSSFISRNWSVAPSSPSVGFKKIKIDKRIKLKTPVKSQCYELSSLTGLEIHPPRIWSYTSASPVYSQRLCPT